MYVLAGALFMALNIVLLGWLLSAATSPRKAGRGLILLLECAKLPGAYFLLYWLVTREYAEPMGLAAGFAVALFAAVLRGLTVGATKRKEA